MKREILFRGKTQYGNWVHGNLDVDGFDNVLIKTYTRHGNSQHYDYCEVNPETVGQFTGLTDKNGKRIFEGDVVSYIGSDYTYVISYENGCFIASHTKIKTYDYTPLKWGGINRFNELSMEIEVIGNIHDKPELL